MSQLQTNQRLANHPSFRQVVAPPLTFIRALTAVPRLVWVVVKFYPSTVRRDDHPHLFSPQKGHKRYDTWISKMLGRLENEAPFLGIHSLNFGGVRSLKLTVQPLKIGVKINLSIVDLSVVFAVWVAQQGCLAGLLLKKMLGWKIKSTTVFTLSGEELYELRRVKK